MAVRSGTGAAQLRRRNRFGARNGCQAGQVQVGVAGAFTTPPVGGGAAGRERGRTLDRGSVEDRRLAVGSGSVEGCRSIENTGDSILCCGFGSTGSGTTCGLPARGGKVDELGGAGRSEIAGTIRHPIRQDGEAAEQSQYERQFTHDSDDGKVSIIPAIIAQVCCRRQKNRRTTGKTLANVLSWLRSQVKGVLDTL